MEKKENLRERLNQILIMAEHVCQFQEQMAKKWKNDIARYETIFLYGTGYDSQLAISFLRDILREKEVYFIDSNPEYHGKEILPGLYCYGLDKAFGYDADSTVILITTTWYANEILGDIFGNPIRGAEKDIDDTQESLLSQKLNGIRVDPWLIRFLYDYYANSHLSVSSLTSHKNELLKVMNLFEDSFSLDVFEQRILQQYGHTSSLRAVVTLPQYFPSVIKERFSENEVFLDCGAAEGDSVKDFRAQTHDMFKAIYSFELDDETYRKLQDNPVTHDSRITLIPAGVSDADRKVLYRTDGCPSYVGVNNSQESSYADVVAIDSLVENGTIKEKVTFVKMDVEGAELDALHGMQKIMKEHKPKLAICVYHKPEDLWEIPLYIHSIVPEYKFILRHHQPINFCETVLYAYIP